MKKHLAFAAICLTVVLFGAYRFQHDDAPVKPVFSDWVLEYGAEGKDVTELQGRMKFLGFYFGDVDGIFGWRTLNSVKYFQSEFGMDVDGVVGPKMKLKLWEATKNWRPTAADVPNKEKAETTNKGNQQAGAENTGEQTAAEGNNNQDNMTPSNHLGLSSNDLKIMANAVYGESRGEPYIGQVAVAAVILNRVHSKSFPNTVSGVIFQPGAFTAVADGQIWLEPNDSARKAVQDAINGTDPTDGCEYYFNPETATSKWIWTRPQVKTIGKHIFCR